MLFVALAAFGAQLPQGTIVVAKTQGNGIVIWDITPSVAGIVSASTSPDATVKDLEVDAASILLDRLSQMSAASTVEVRVLYQMTGETSPIYRNNTFGGLEKVLTVTASVEEATRNKTAWAAQLAKNTLPAGMTVTVVGKLPPKQ